MQVYGTIPAIRNRNRDKETKEWIRRCDVRIALLIISYCLVFVLIKNKLLHQPLTRANQFLVDLAVSSHHTGEYQH
jgi:hypothetical protein